MYFFRMSGICRTCSSKWSGMEHSARPNRTVCRVYHILRWCRRNQNGGTDYLFFYTLLIFLKLRNTKEMRGFFRGEEGLCKLWIQSPIVLYINHFGANLIPGRTQELRNVRFPFPPSIQLINKKKLFGLQHHCPLMDLWVSNYF